MHLIFSTKTIGIAKLGRQFAKAALLWPSGHCLSKKLLGLTLWPVIGL